MMKTINGAMRNIFTIGIVLLSAAVFGGCTSSLYSNYNNDDLYGTHDRVAIAKAEARQAEIEKAEAEAVATKAMARINIFFIWIFFRILWLYHQLQNTLAFRSLI